MAINEHPSMARLLSQERHSLLSEMREKTKLALAHDPKTARDLYVVSTNSFSAGYSNR